MKFGMLMDESRRRECRGAERGEDWGVGVPVPNREEPREGSVPLPRIFFRLRMVYFAFILTHGDIV